MDIGNQSLLKNLHRVFPELTNSSKKGQNGRVGVIGGSLQFTGAPFYSAISSLKVGGDLAYIFCSKSASLAIKSYSPQVIVLPVFFSSKEVTIPQEQLQKTYNQWMSAILQWKSAINVWIIGPGLGRDKYMLDFFPKLIRELPQNSLVIFDADGLYFLCKHPYLLPQLNRLRAFLTPNHKEFSFLQKIIDINIEQVYKCCKNDEQIEQIEGFYYDKGYSLFIKGEEDIILSRKKCLIVRTKGGLKRCGGIGDILAGALSVCIFWNQTFGPALAAKIVKIATRQAFDLQGRSLTAPSIIKQLPRVITKLEKSSL